MILCRHRQEASPREQMEQIHWKQIHREQIHREQIHPNQSIRKRSAAIELNESSGGEDLVWSTWRWTKSWIVLSP